MEKTKTMFHNKYFQGILQLRDHDKELVEYIQNIIDKEGRNDIYLSRIIKVRGGTDLYLTSNKFLRKLGKRLLREIEGELKEKILSYRADSVTNQNNLLVETTELSLGPLGREKPISMAGKALAVMTNLTIYE